jgi:hypothetical protein
MYEARRLSQSLPCRLMQVRTSRGVLFLGGKVDFPQPTDPMTATMLSHYESIMQRHGLGEGGGVLYTSTPPPLCREPRRRFSHQCPQGDLCFLMRRPLSHGFSNSTSPHARRGWLSPSGGYASPPSSSPARMMGRPLSSGHDDWRLVSLAPFVPAQKVICV